MSALTWVQPPDLLAHELVASSQEAKEVGDIRARWEGAGGQTGASADGLHQEGDAALRELAVELLDELERRPPSAQLTSVEPEELTRIEATWPGSPGTTELGATLEDRVHGAWIGRAAGCLLGKPVEKIPRQGIREILSSQGRWPLESWFTAVGLPDEIAERWPWNRRSAPTSLAENIDGMPEDDDVNFAMLALDVLERHGHGLTTEDVAGAWLAGLPAGRVFTAERVAYRNLLLGHVAPRTAVHHNPYREWIGAQIRADVYGWVCPGDPAAAARLAWQDARLSHVRSGVYGAMFVAALCSQAVVSDDVDDVLEVALSVVPPGSRYAEAVRHGVRLGSSPRATEDCVDDLYRDYGQLHWVHVLNNTALLTFALTRSEGDFAEGVCTAVMGGWDTDSVAATVGSVCGALAGARRLPPTWVEPMRNRVRSSLPGFDGVGFDELAARTVRMVRQ